MATLTCAFGIHIFGNSMIHQYIYFPIADMIETGVVMSNKRKKQISLRHGCAKYGGMREVVRKVVREI